MSRLQKKFTELNKQGRAALVSYVVAGDPNPKISQDVLIETADKALYRAKQLGRNQIYYQPLPSVE